MVALVGKKKKQKKKSTSGEQKWERRGENGLVWIGFNSKQFDFSLPFWEATSKY